MEISNDAFNSLQYYFMSLGHLGYKSYKEVDNLLAMLFIEEILTDMWEFVTEKDYKMMSDLLYCIYGTCMIPYPSYLNGMKELTVKTKLPYRVTEDYIVRESYDLLRSV